jgi:hypothetical protein
MGVNKYTCQPPLLVVEKNLNVYLVGNEQEPNSCLNYLRQAYELASPRKHTIVNAPDKSEIILFVDSTESNFYEALRKHPLVQQFPDKCFVYEERDIMIPFLAGVYTSVQKSLFNLGRLRNYCYLSRHTFSQNSYVTAKKESKDLLFSFLGGSTSLVRKRLYNINFNRSDVLVEDTSYYEHWNPCQEGRDRMQQKYVEICARSQFVLCPRGAGSGSIRLFEMMEMGTVPVIISDNYLLPEGPEWEKFTVFIKEKNIKRIPEVLAQYISAVEEMGSLARKAWEEWFSPAKQFNYIIDSCWDIQNKRLIPERVYRMSWKLHICQLLVISVIRSNLKKITLQAFKLLKIKFPYHLNRVL